MPLITCNVRPYLPPSDAFLEDENVSRFVIERPRAAGFDASPIREARSGAPDREVLDAAAGEGRILVTEDRDPGDMVVRQRLGVPGIILRNWIACRIRRKLRW